MPLVFYHDTINGILFTLHSYNELPIVAHQKLMEMTGEKVMDLDQVTEFFKKIENGEVRLKKAIEEVTLTQILNVPNFVEKYLDIDTRLRLSKTCTTLRKIISEKLLEIDCFEYNCNEKSIEISINEDFKILYETIERGLRVTNGDRVKVINTNNEEEQMEIIQRDLISILGSEKLRIGRFRIENWQFALENWQCCFDGKPPIGLRALRNTLSQVHNKLKTIDPKHLKFLQLRIKNFDYVYYNWSLPRNVPNLEEWKRMKSLNPSNPQLTLSDVIRFFTHVEKARLAIPSFHGLMDVSPLHISIRKLKNKLLQSPNLKLFKISADQKMSDSEFEDINASLQNYNTNNNQWPCWVKIPYPNSDKNLQLRVKNDVIWFKGPCYAKEEDTDEDDDDEDEMLP